MAFREMKKTISEKFADFVVNLSYKSLPVSVIEEAKTLIYYNLVMGMTASNTEYAHTAKEFAKSLDSGCQQATVIYDGNKFNVLGASFVNSVMMHSRTQEDSHDKSQSHHGTMVIPVSLGLGEYLQRSGEDLITAVIAGYEIGARIGRSGTMATTLRGFRASSLYGIFGSTAAAAKLLSLSQNGVQNALGIAASLASGLNQPFVSGTDEWRYQVGFASRNAITAAMIAQEGGIASREVFEGKNGFFRAFIGKEIDPDELTSDLGISYEILNISYKAFPACSLSQAPILTMLALKEQFRPSLDQIEEILVRMDPLAVSYPGVNDSGPFKSLGQTQMSVIFAVATALLREKPILRHFEIFDDPSFIALASKIKVVARPNLGVTNIAYCEIQITMKDGQKNVKNLHLVPNDFIFESSKVKDIVMDVAAEHPRLTQKVPKIIEIVEDIESAADLKKLIDVLVVRE